MCHKASTEPVVQQWYAPLWWLDVVAALGATAWDGTGLLQPASLRSCVLGGDAGEGE